MDDAAKSPEFRTDCSRARNAPPFTSCRGLLTIYWAPLTRLVGEAAIFRCYFC
jgi:hypothetical protein